MDIKYQEDSILHNNKQGISSTSDKPIIRLRSLSTLLELTNNNENKRNESNDKHKGRYLKHALKKTMKEQFNLEREECNVIDVFESMVNGKIIHANASEYCCNKSNKGFIRMEEENVNSLNSSMFGKVYPSYSEKRYGNAVKSEMFIGDSKYQQESNIDIEDYYTMEHSHATSMVPSIFGKVYVKKPQKNEDLSFLNKCNFPVVEPTRRTYEQIDKMKKRKRDDLDE